MIESIFRSENYVATKAMLDVASARHAALASNIANVETPGYRRVDIAQSFSEALKAEMARGDEAGMAAMTPVIAPDASAPSVRADGNTVQMDRELLAMSQNSTNYDVLTRFASGSLAQLKTAITGRVA